MESNSHAWLEYFEQWHEFFLMAGTAAVTLAGLLFVAISLHVETLVHESREHLLELARATLMTFVMVLVLSLMMLVPQINQRIVGFQLLVLGGVFTVLTVRLLLFVPKSSDEHFSTRLFRRRLILPLVGYVWVGMTGAVLLMGGAPRSMMMIIGAVCMLLGNASGTSWDLLVRVARLKRANIASGRV